MKKTGCLEKRINNCIIMEKIMVTKSHYNKIKNKYGRYASWAIWADEESKPKSKIGDLSIFNLSENPKLLEQLNPNVIMVGLNISRSVTGDIFRNFHDESPKNNDFKIRYTFQNTPFYGAYMTDVIKEHVEASSSKVYSCLKKHPEVELKNINRFNEELKCLNVKDPLIIAFGNTSYEILNRHYKGKYRLVKIPHYSYRFRGYDKPGYYRKKVLEILKKVVPVQEVWGSEILFD